MTPRSHDTIYGLLGAWANETPEAVALVSPGHEPVTYWQLWEQLDSTVNGLREIGIGRDDRSRSP